MKNGGSRIFYPYSKNISSDVLSRTYDIYFVLMDRVTAENHFWKICMSLSQKNNFLVLDTVAKKSIILETYKVYDLTFCPWSDFTNEL